MELMDISLDKFYRFTHRRLQQKIPESILGKIALAVTEPRPRPVSFTFLTVRFVFVSYRRSRR